MLIVRCLWDLQQGRQYVCVCITMAVVKEVGGKYLLLLSSNMWESWQVLFTSLWSFLFWCLLLGPQHGKPLEDVIFFPSGGLLASAGGTEVKIWDIVGGGRQLQMSGSHQKTVTSLAMAAPGNSIAPGEHDSLRLLTGSLDGHVKVFELNQLKVCCDLPALHSLVSCLMCPS